MLMGTSLFSYFLFRAAKREGCLDRTIHSYAGVLEKELGDYSGDMRYILREKIGKIFTSEEALERVTYVFPSKHCKQTVEEIHNINLSNAHIIPNGVPKEFFIENFKRSPPKQLTIGYISRIRHVKNPEFFLNLKENLGKDKKEPVILKIITDLVSAMKNPIGMSLLDKINNGDILFYTSRPPTELSHFYRTQVSAILVPSLFETFSNVAIESIVTGTPVLLSNNAGAKEVFERHGLDDLIFSINEWDSFYSALNAAKKMDFIIDEKTRKKIHSELSWDNIIKQYNKIAEDIVAKF